MSPYSAFVYNILTMGLIFRGHTFGLRRAARRQPVLGIILAMILEIPIA
jgi:hypothetical protein